MNMKKIIAMVAGLLCLTGCLKNSEDLVLINEIMNVQGAILINDAGVKYGVADTKIMSNFQSAKRVYIIGQIEPAPAGSNYDYKLYIEEFLAVAVQDCVKLSTVEDQSALGIDPANFYNLWIDGGYINAMITFSYDQHLGYDGVANLVFDDTRSTAQDLYFILKNNQKGKSWIDEEIVPSNLTYGGTFFSFPYLTLLDSAYKGQVNLHFEWTWFQMDPENKEIPLHTTEARSEILTINVE